MMPEPLGEAVNIVLMLMSLAHTPSVGSWTAARMERSTESMVWIGPATRQAASVAFPEAASDRG